MHISGDVLLLSARFASTKSRNSASLAWRCAGYESESNLFDLENGVDDGLRPYIRRNGETPVDEWVEVQ